MFMFDEQKGLIKAFNDVLSYMSYSFCVRHRPNNFKRVYFGGVILKKKLCAATNASTIKKFYYFMKNISKLDLSVSTWLNDKEPSEWSRLHFFSDVKCDILLNNLCEVFNSMMLILEKRQL